MFTEQDTACIRAHGLTPEAVERQLENIRRGFPFLKVVRAAAPGDGILVPAPQEVAAAMRRYDEAAARLGIVKFVPASGAATRMFKELFAFVEEGRRSEGIDRLLQNIERFAFWPELRATLPAGADDRTVVEHIIGKGLGYGGRPKGLVTFHAYAEGARKAAEEHLVEGAQYAAAGGRVALGGPVLGCVALGCGLPTFAVSATSVWSGAGATPYLISEGSILFIRRP